MSKRPSSDRQPSGLIKALDGLGRTRGSSATPVQSGLLMLSPQPQRDLQAQIENMNSDMRRATIIQGNPDQNVVLANRTGSMLQKQGGVRHQRGQSSSTRSGASTQEQGVKIGHHARELSLNAYQSNSIQDMGFSSAAADPGTFQFPRRQGGSLHESSCRMAVNELAAKFQEKLTELQQMILKATEIPNNVQELLTQELRKISQQFNDQQRSIQKEFDRVKNERDELRRQLQTAREDRKELEMKHKKSSDRFEEVESRWKRAQESLIDQIAFQKEQLEGKRALWMDANPGSSARRDAMTALRDPFQSPSANHTPSYSGGALSSMTSPSVMSQSQNAFYPTSMGPPRIQFNNAGGYSAGTFNNTAGYNSGYNVGSSNPGGPRNQPNAPVRPRKGTLPTGVPLSATQMPVPPGFSIFGSTQHFVTEPRTPPPSNAVVLRQSDEELALEYRAAISKLYDLVEGWVRKYSSVPNQTNDRAIASGNDILWDYMMNCTYPGHRQDSHTHAVALLNDLNTRFWFVMRMATQYCVKDIMAIKAFKPYSKSMEKIIDMVLLKLQERGLNNEARQQYIDQGSRAVQSVVAAKDYHSFRAKQLGVHTKALRDMLGPMLNADAARAQAGTDLGAIVVHSWELSCKMHSARLTFQIYFPETSSKFTAATMKAKDQTKIDPMQLQIQQARLKLVITPVITMRDDRGTTIRAKSILSSNVLLMK